MSSHPNTLLTEKVYLAIERRAGFRSEFHGGEMFAMVGANRRHNRIVTNLVHDQETFWVMDREAL